MVKAKIQSMHDKKMLWRANLYIDEGQNDWNILHPWNAPAGPTATANNVPSGGIPWWAKKADGSFDDRWGYNEWNRVHDGMISNPIIFSSIRELPAGNGTQIIKMVPFLPIRDQGLAGALQGTVAYSFPKHDFEQYSESGQDGDAGSQDSPFDFNRKMLYQVKLLSKQYNKAGLSWKKPRWNWPDRIADSVNIEEFSFSEYSDYCFTPPTGTTAVNWEQKRATLGKSLEEWDRVLPPVDNWSAYAVQDPGANITTKSFLPSFGLGYMAGFKTNQTSTSFTNRKKYWILEAGTDCIGFAQRSASWYFHFNGYNDKIDNPYSWATSAVSWTESEKAAQDNIFKVVGWRQSSDNFYALETAYGENRRKYLKNRAGVDAAYTIIQTRDVGENTFMKKSGWNAVEKQAALAKLKLVKPGDIFVKDSPLTSEPITAGKPEDIEWNNHIAIVVKIPDNPESITDPQTYLDQLLLIEAEYGNLIQSVIKKLSIGNYNQSKVVGPMQIYDSFTLGKDVELPLNCDSWAIRRLK